MIMRPLTIIILLLFPGYLASQDQLVLESGYLNQPDTVWVFTPASYQTSPHDSFAVVYLLHGWSGYHQYWDEIIGCQSYADKYGFIIVCPDGFYDSWYLNSPVATEDQYEDFFVKELIPLINKRFRTQEDHVFITGLSMGGHGALYLYAQHSNLFMSAGSLSGLLRLSAWRDQFGISRILGLDKTRDDEQVLWDYSVAGKTDQLKSAGKEIILSCGTEDPFYGINVNFTDACRRNNIPFQFIVGPGGHDSTYWHSAIDGHLIFFNGLAKGSRE